MMRVLLALLLSGGLTAGLIDSAIAGDPDKKGPMGLERGFSWDDQDGEVSYHVVGSAVYWPAKPCSPLAGGPIVGNGRVEFDQQLPANTTSYTPPAASDPRLTAMKEVNFRIEALDASGAVLISDGYNSTADAFCTEEEIAARIAAAGSGPGPSGDSLLQVLSSALAALGAIAIGGALLLRRRRAS